MERALRDPRAVILGAQGMKFVETPKCVVEKIMEKKTRKYTTYPKKCSTLEEMKCNSWKKDLLFFTYNMFLFPYGFSIDFPKVQLITQQPRFWWSFGHFTLRQIHHQARIRITKNHGEVVLHGSIDGGSMKAVPQKKRKAGSFFCWEVNAVNLRFLWSRMAIPFGWCSLLNF